MTYFIMTTLTLSVIFYFFLAIVSGEDIGSDIKEAKPAFIFAVVLTALNLISLTIMVLEYV